MPVVPLSRPFNTETVAEPAVINSLNDPLCQGRVCFMTSTLSGVDTSKLPWGKMPQNHSQVTTDQGGTTEAAHSFKVGDMILVYRPTASAQDWIIYGHPGTIGNTGGGDGTGSTTGPQNFYWNSDLRTANTQSAKPKVVKTTYPADGQPTWTNPGQVQFQLSDQPDVRKFYDKKGGQFNLPALYQSDLWNQAQNIIASAAVGSPVTQVILQQDENFISEAQKNNQALQMLHRLRMELNTPDFNQFVPKAQAGLVQTFQGLLSGGGLSGLQGLVGMAENLLSAFQSIGQQSTNTGQQQNQSAANNQFLGANGVVLSQ